MLSLCLWHAEPEPVPVCAYVLEIMCMWAGGVSVSWGMHFNHVHVC